MYTVVRKVKITVPCLLSTSISEVKAVPPTVHSSTGAAKFPTWENYAGHNKGKTPVRITKLHNNWELTSYWKDGNYTTKRS